MAERRLPTAGVRGYVAAKLTYEDLEVLHRCIAARQETLEPGPEMEAVKSLRKYFDHLITQWWWGK